MKKFQVIKNQQPKPQGFIVRLVAWKLGILDFFSPLSLVALRIYMGLVFWRSGLTKIVNFDSTILLFESEYQTADKITLFGHKFLTPEIAAYMGTFNELVFSMLLIIGFGGRLAAFVLLCMTAVIQFTYTTSPEHVVWAIMLSVILFMGAGRASWDYFIRGSVMGHIDNIPLREKSFAALCTLCVSIFAAYLVFKDVIQPH